MRVRLDQVQQEPFTWQEEVQLSSAEVAEAELINLSPLSCRGDLRCAGSGYVLEARLRYSQTLSCYRCLEPSRQEVDFGFQVLVLRGPEEDRPNEEELEEQDLDTLRVEGDELDTLPLIREQVLLNTPMKPLCASDCQGLCVECGTNLNLEPCSCFRVSGDPRWQGLAGLRERLSAPAQPSTKRAEPSRTLQLPPRPPLAPENETWLIIDTPPRAP